MNKKSYDINELDDAAQWLLTEAGNKKVMALHGEMGAGKTTLVTAACRQLGAEEAVSSPTFSIINEYRYNEKGVEKSIFHIDLYRLKSEEEAVNAGVEDCLYSGNYCFVEWPERAPTLFPQETISIFLHRDGETGRTIEITDN